MSNENNFNFNLISLGIGFAIGVGVLYVIVHAWPLFLLAGAGYVIQKGIPDYSSEKENTKDTG
ncbi:hypothetical protein CMI41_01040 [Candidatus Pacearchaeota archaeon]|jgi:hypothetical protein|nr:hypothetical protein [Candidatus Pacearchaeota archaeon]|tara:strand:- start:20269 stop:20457 length:189 start_codon:yes stop_codon:yes gene_type:complete